MNHYNKPLVASALSLSKAAIVGGVRGAAITTTPPINLNDLKELVSLIKDEDIAVFKENLSKIFKQKVEYKKERESNKQKAALAA